MEFGVVNRRRGGLRPATPANGTECDADPITGVAG